MTEKKYNCKRLQYRPGRVLKKFWTTNIESAGCIPASGQRVEPALLSILSFLVLHKLPVTAVISVPELPGSLCIVTECTQFRSIIQVDPDGCNMARIYTDPVDGTFTKVRDFLIVPEIDSLSYYAASMHAVLDENCKKCQAKIPNHKERAKEPPAS